MITKFMYLRDKENRPIVTICLLKKKIKSVIEDPIYSIYGKGIALCSDCDYPIKKKGRNIAYERALLALMVQENSLPILRKEGKKILQKLPDFKIYCDNNIDIYKSTTFLTSKEIKILNSKPKKISFLRKIIKIIKKIF